MDLGQGCDVAKDALRRANQAVHGLWIDASDQVGQVAHFSLHRVRRRANYSLAGDALCRLSLLRQLSVIHNYLHKRHFLEEDFFLIVDVLREGQQYVELVELIPSSHTTLNRDIQVVDGPFPQIFHACLALVQVMIGQRLKLSPFV